MVERIEIRGGITSDGEPRVEVNDEEGLRGFIVGMGEDTRTAHFTRDSLLGGELIMGKAASESALSKLEREMKEVGAEPIGMDSPDLGRSQHGWSGSIWDERYSEIFGHE